MAAGTIRHALTEQSRLEVDLSLGFPTRFGYGLMLGAQVLSLYGRDTQHAFGHLGFTNMLAWADPERATACAVMTNGKRFSYRTRRTAAAGRSKVSAGGPFPLTGPCKITVFAALSCPVGQASRQ